MCIRDRLLPVLTSTRQAPCRSRSSRCSSLACPWLAPACGSHPTRRARVTGSRRNGSTAPGSGLTATAQSTTNPTLTRTATPTFTGCHGRSKTTPPCPLITCATPKPCTPGSGIADTSSASGSPLRARSTTCGTRTGTSFTICRRWPDTSVSASITAPLMPPLVYSSACPPNHARGSTCSTNGATTPPRPACASPTGNYPPGCVNGWAAARTRGSSGCSSTPPPRLSRCNCTPTAPTRWPCSTR